MKVSAVIGKNFGDEGKGLACASLSKYIKNTLIIKHNGGAQAGHTVEEENGRRFIHHQIGAGAEYGASTLLADTFLADLYQLGKELKSFRENYGFTPVIYAEKNTKVTIIDDVLRNMLIESARGKERHGSCGMGINECRKRNTRGLSLSLAEIRDMSKEELLQRLRMFRIKYEKENNRILSDNPEQNLIQTEYYKLLKDDEILCGYAECLKEAINSIRLVDTYADWLSGFEQIVFETGQGLLLDEDLEEYAPYLTPSKTGLYNITRFLEKRKIPLNEVIYVTRPYVTRHGNGPLPCEIKRDELRGVSEDMTNLDNEWQGSLRYAKHESMETFTAPIIQDMQSVKEFQCMKYTDVSLLFTHLDETNDKVYFKDFTVYADKLAKELRESYGFSQIYTSHSRFNTSITKNCID